MGLELFRGPENHPDRSVAEFVTDHFGQETLDYIAEPLLSGVYGGDPREMSVNSVLAPFVEMEKKTGSLGMAVLKTRTASKGGGSLFRTLKGGLGTMVEALSRGLKAREGSVETIERQGSGFRVRVNGDWMEASSVILAVPAWAAAGIVATLDGALSSLLGSIPYTSSATVTLCYDEAKFDGKRAGHGFLIPRVERARMAACTFVGSKFDHRAPAKRILLRCFFGGAGDDAVLNETDEALVALAREELRVILGLNAEPLFTSVTRCPRSMAQYTVGHAARLKEIQARVTAIPGLYLAGNGYTGIGIPDCIRTGRAAAASALKAAAVAS